MTQLQITPEAGITIILFLISFISFIFVYNRVIKDRVDKEDLKEVYRYVDKRDESGHKRIDETNIRLTSIKDEINRKLDLIIDKLIK